MKVVIANGMHEADYIIKTFKSKDNKIVVINKDKSMCDYLSFENGIKCICGDATQKYILDTAEINDFDVFVSLSQNDVENYVACIMAKKLFNIKKCIAKVINPKNVDLFKFLGVDSVISSSYLLGQTIESESKMDNFIRSLSLMDSKIEMSEIVIDEQSEVANKKLKDIRFPQPAQLCCIYRNPSVIIPNGNTLIKPGDRVVAIYAPEVKEKLFEMLQRNN